MDGDARLGMMGAVRKGAESDEVFFPPSLALPPPHAVCQEGYPALAVDSPARSDRVSMDTGGGFFSQTRNIGSCGVDPLCIGGRCVSSGKGLLSSSRFLALKFY